MSSDRLEERLIQRAASLRRPVSVTIELVPYCNLDCNMCFVDHRSGEPIHLKRAQEWKTLAEQFADAGVLFLTITGGEPLLHPDFREIYRSFYQEGMIITLNTNGTLIDEQTADFFAEYPPRRVNLTLYGLDDETYEGLCHNRSGYQKALQGIRLLQERQISLKLNASLVKRNAGQWMELNRFAIGHHLNIQPDTYMFPGAKEHLLPEEKRARLAPEEAARMEYISLRQAYPGGKWTEYLKEFAANLQAPGSVSSRHLNCHAGQTSFALDAEGFISPCVSMKLRKWNTFEEGLLPAWEKLCAFTDAILISEECAACTFKHLCPGCAAAAILETGKADGRPDYLCRYTGILANQLICDCREYLDRESSDRESPDRESPDRDFQK